MTPALAFTASAYPRHMIRASVPVRTLTAALVALFALDNVLLLGLLGASPLLVAGLAVVAPAVLALLTHRAMPTASRIDLKTILLCFAVAVILLILGGEGRIFYATPDWQIRDAVLADMGKHHWPFDYWLDGKAQMLRAPVGMYLIPSLLGGASQIGRDWALLGHNCLILGLLLAQGAALFEGHRARLIGLVTFLMFSGLDIVGNVITQVATGHADWEHIERWAGNYQYSSHITQLFWVPQHAFAGWAMALTYMLWRKGLAPIGLFAASLPLVALWSPLALFGALPFAVYAAIHTLKTRAWDWRDVLLCGGAALLAMPALLYLSADAASVGSGPFPFTLFAYLLMLVLEVWPFLSPLLRDRKETADHPTIFIAAACLLLMPLWAIGMNNDFQMRGSITPLALIAIAYAHWATRLESRRGKAAFLTVIALGSVTGTVEIVRAFRLAPTPPPHCSLVEAWDQQTGYVVSHASYFARRETMPVRVDTAERVDSAPSARCWDRPWHMWRGRFAEQQGRS